MTTATVIQKVRSRLGKLDEGGEQIIAAALEVLKEADGARSHLASEAETFTSKNISMATYIALSSDERVRYQNAAETANRAWIDRQFETFEANWIIVVEGQVVKHGASLGDYPRETEIHELQEQTGKCPFIFFSPFLLAVEEIHTQWHTTNKAKDYYPALTLKISGLNQSFKIEADLDTGALECYSDLNLMTTRGIVKREPRDIGHLANHLSQPFTYFAKDAVVGILDVNGAAQELLTTIICVENWHRGPFANINPDRTFLLGRRLLLEPRPRVVLDFDARQSEVQFKEQAG